MRDQLAKKIRRKRVRDRLARAFEQKRQRREQASCQPQPRYDKVYFEGLACLDNLAEEDNKSLFYASSHLNSQYSLEPEGEDLDLDLDEEDSANEGPFIYTCDYCGAQMGVENVTNHGCSTNPNRHRRSRMIHRDENKPENYSDGDQRSEEPNIKDPWKHRSARMCCATCMWFVPKAKALGSENTVPVGRCRKRAPTMDGYPVVFETDWCGDHKVDENKN